MKPTVCAVLVWFDEPPDALGRCVRSLAPIVDKLLAVDGRWQHYPARYDLSLIEQRVAIRDAAAVASIEAHVPTVDAPWESQVAKRSWSYAMAAELADWILVIDADEHITDAAPTVLTSLAQTDLDVATIMCDRYRNDALSKQRPIRRLFRASAGLSVIDTHNRVVTADGRNLGGDHGLIREPALDLTSKITIRHDAWSRGAQRNQQSKHYYADVHRYVGRH